jgi:hypothetical protein
MAKAPPTPPSRISADGVLGLVYADDNDNDNVVLNVERLERALQISDGLRFVAVPPTTPREKHDAAALYARTRPATFRTIARGGWTVLLPHGDYWRGSADHAPDIYPAWCGHVWLSASLHDQANRVDDTRDFGMYADDPRVCELPATLDPVVRLSYPEMLATIARGDADPARRYMLDPVTVPDDALPVSIVEPSYNLVMCDINADVVVVARAVGIDIALPPLATRNARGDPARLWTWKRVN